MHDAGGTPMVDKFRHVIKENCLEVQDLTTLSNEDYSDLGIPNMGDSTESKHKQKLLEIIGSCPLEAMPRIKSRRSCPLGAMM
jgi:hypothetical protein